MSLGVLLGAELLEQRIPHTKSGDPARTDENQENSSRNKMASKKLFERELAKRTLQLEDIMENR